MDDKNMLDAMMFMAEAMSKGSSRAVTDSEKRGQDQMVNGDALPIDCPREALEQLGFVFGERIDDLFVNVVMPDGWEKVPTDHSMWSDLIDPQGRKRGSIFYKAAFYDRSAKLHLDCRYWVDMDSVGGRDAYESYDDYRDADQVVTVIDKFTGETIYTSDPFQPPSDYVERLKVREAWINEHYPDWRNPAAYW